MKDFTYVAAGSVQEATKVLAGSKGVARVLAGGTDLIVQLREGTRDADVVVDVKKIPELNELQFSEKHGLRLGASVPCYKIYENAEVAHCYGALADSTKIIGGWQIQSRASVGGNLCNASPAADSIPALIAHHAYCEVAGPTGIHNVAVENFCVAPGKNCLKPGEFLVHLVFPPSLPHSGSAYLRFIPRNEMDIAVVGVGARVQLTAGLDKIEFARIGLGAVGPVPKYAQEASEWLAGKPLTEATYAQAGELAKKVATPISDMRGTAEYRMHLVGVMVKRTLEVAVSRALGHVAKH